MNPEKPSGVLLVDKPTGITSARAVAAVKRSLPRKTKVGHTGTLDPLASGLLVLMIGKATRLSRYIGDMQKTYTATAKFGAVSDSLDADGNITPLDVGIPAKDDLIAAIPEFTGKIMQTPPMASAVKVGGRRLYDIHRSGAEVEREARLVTVHSFDLISYFLQDDSAEFGIRCGGGTYVRSLIADLAESLDTGAYLTALRRDGVGTFSASDAIPVDGISPETMESHLLDARTAVPEMRIFEATEEMRGSVSNGSPLPSSGIPGDVAVVSSDDGTLLAVYHDDGEHFARPEVVLCAG